MGEMDQDLVSTESAIDQAVWDGKPKAGTKTKRVNDPARIRPIDSRQCYARVIFSPQLDLQLRRATPKM